MKDTGGDEPAVSVCRQFFKTMCRFVQRVLLKVSSQRLYKNALLWGLLQQSHWDLLSVCLCDIFICTSTMTPQPDWMACARWAVTLSLAILSQKSCREEVCSQAVFLQSAHCSSPLHSSSSNLFQVTQASAVPRHFFIFFMLCPVDTYYSNAAFAAQSHMFCL